MNIEPESILISAYNYDLPQHRIAAFPLAQRDASRLLIYKKGTITDDHFYNLPQHLPADSTIVLNDTRVIEARIFFKKDTGGIIEIFCLEPFQQSMELSLQQTGSVTWECLIGGASKWKKGQALQKELMVDGQTVILSATYVDKRSDHFLISFSWQPSSISFINVLHAAGAIPLPPYIKREATVADEERYQTVFSRQEGSVAAPTAALHFTKSMFEELSQKKVVPTYITLHVGAGTFKPVKTKTIASHQMHGEPFTVSKDVLHTILSSKKIIAVGTTSLRTLESIYWIGVKLIHGLITGGWVLQQWEAYELSQKFPGITPAHALQSLVNWLEENNVDKIYCHTSLIIVPGYQFKIPQGLITNFHQPQSTLLLLVSAFIGEEWKKVYQHALDHDYRFLSYGDSSLLWKEERE